MISPRSQCPLMGITESGPHLMFGDFKSDEKVNLSPSCSSRRNGSQGCDRRTGNQPTRA